MRTKFQSLGVLILALAAIEARATERVERKVSVEQALAQGAKLSLENLLGSITIRGGEERRVARIEATVVAEAKTREEAQALVDAVSLRTTGSKASFDVHVTFPVERHSAFKFPKDERQALLERWVAAALERGSVGTEYGGSLVQVGRQKGAAAVAVYLEVELPMDVQASFRQIVGTIDGGVTRGDLKLDVVEGRIYADHVYGTLRARSGGGSVEVTSFSGDELAVETASSDLALADVRTRNARLSSGSGSIQIHGIVAEALEVSSSSGDVAMEDLEPVRLVVATGTGDVDLAPSFSGTREASVNTETGDVILRVSDIASFSLAAATRSGEVRAEGLELSPLEPKDGRVRYKRGIGGPEVQVTAKAGAVVVRSQR